MERIFRLGKEDNFWEHGAGPCGPCSEIYYDRGEEYGCGKPGCTRWLRLRPLHGSSGTMYSPSSTMTERVNYEPLKQKNIDTGMGLERLAVIVQDVDSIFDVDTMQGTARQGMRVCRDCCIRPTRMKDVSIRADHRPYPFRDLYDFRWHHAVQRGKRICTSPSAAPCRTSRKTSWH